ncbi:hypothetical protein RCL_jg8251.t1 [Rhizophagus clarus]|uniref:Uncharacterized protein n=1 Tax=Rhizophagus clarus TaxID=94130 RepID=A0A8H3ME46_9GLOM|nr:hypothetical protein RCL_jg8251.t1 [Rhizophagus clarus]
MSAYYLFTRNQSYDNNNMVQDRFKHMRLTISPFLKFDIWIFNFKLTKSLNKYAQLSKCDVRPIPASTNENTA